VSRAALQGSKAVIALLRWNGWIEMIESNNNPTAIGVVSVLAKINALPGPERQATMVHG